MTLIAPDYKQKKAAKKKNGFFPAVTTREECDAAIRQGWIAAYFVAATTALLTLIAMFYDLRIVQGIDAWAFIDVGIMAACGIAMQMLRSRVAAGIALAVFLYGKIYAVQAGQNLNFSGWLVAAVLTLCFVNALRGTLAHHKLAPSPGGRPATPKLPGAGA